MYRTIVYLLASLFVLAASSSAMADDKQDKMEKSQSSQKSDTELIKLAESAAPDEIGRNATVVKMGEDGKLQTLREGTNDFTCLADNPSTPKADPLCADPHAWKWGQSYLNKEPKPTNTQPGVAYMLQGGQGLSASDPFAKPSGEFVETGPHWMILWPFDSETTGLSKTPQKEGTWIMWEGTPYAHLMVMQDPQAKQQHAKARQ